jgi:hypothetical protein
MNKIKLVEIDVWTRDHCLVLMIYGAYTEECFFFSSSCAACPGEGLTWRTLPEVLDSSITDVATYNRGVTTDICTIETALHLNSLLHVFVENL